MNASQSHKSDSSSSHRVFVLLCLGAALVCLERLCRYSFFPIDKDALHYYLSWKIFSASAISDFGRLFWTPSLDCGRPVLADPVTQSLYPGQLLFYVLPSVIAWKVNVSLHFILQFWGVRKFSLEFQDNKTGATVAAITTVLSGALLSHHWSPIWFCGLAWFPFALVYSQRLISQTFSAKQSIESRQNAVKLAACYTLLILAGSVELLLAVFYFIVYSVLFHGLRDIYRSKTKTETVKKQLPIAMWLLVAGLLALAMSSVQLVPTLELTSLSDRASGLKQGELNTWAFFPARFIETVSPAFFGSNHGDYWIVSFFTGDFRSFKPFLTSCYVGYGVYCLAALGLLKFDWSRRLFFGITLLFLLGLALGPGYGVFDFAQRFLPGVKAFRYTEKIFTLVPVFLAPLVACGVAQILNHSKLVQSSHYRRVLGLLHCLALSALLALFLGQGYIVEHYVSRYHSVGMNTVNATEIVEQMQWAVIRGYIPLVLLTIVTQLNVLIQFLRRKQIWAVLIIAIMVTDLGYHSSCSVSHQPTATIFEPSPLWVFNRKFMNKRRRIASERPFIRVRVVPQHGQLFGFDSLDAYGSARIKSRQDFDDAFARQGEEERLRQYQSSVDFAVLLDSKTKSIIEFRKRQPIGRINWLESVAPLNPSKSQSKNVGLAAYLQRHPNGALLDTQLPANSAQRKYDPVNLNSIEIVKDTAADLQLKVETQQERWLIVRDTFYPGWTASIDGKTTEIVAANHCFRAVKVPAGKHVVRMTFSPSYFLPSVLAAIVAFLISVALFFLGNAKARESLQKVPEEQPDTE